MIKLRKLQIPDVLQRNAEKWLKEQNKKQKDNASFRGANYKHQDIKDRLKDETHEKCAYCESKFSSVGYGQIDHIKPKSKYPDKTFDWDNLTLSCEICNGKKSDYDSEEKPLINPYVDDPSDDLCPLGPMFRGISDLGSVAINILDLNRSALILKKAEKLEALERLVKEWERETDTSYKEVLRQQLIQEASDEAEYTCTIKGYLTEVGLLD